MTTVLLVRHGMTAATGHALSGWTPGVLLDERGAAQARALGVRLAGLPLDAVITSPLERCRQTAETLVAADGRWPAVTQDVRFAECRYGEWTGKPLRRLAKEPLWRVVQAHPSGVRFPGPDGESMLDVQHRAVEGLRDWNRRLGRDATYLVCAHGDVIKAMIADSLGLHLDMSQRIQVDPCSLSVIRYTPLRPFLIRMNDTGGGVAGLVHTDGGKSAGRGHRSHDADSDAMIGGGAGGIADREDGAAVPVDSGTGGSAADGIRQDPLDTQG